MVGVSLMSNPLINDYIRKDSRGKAVAVMGIGVLAGECFSVIVLFGLTKNMELVRGFTISSIALLVLGLPLIYLITEPVIMAKVLERDNESETRLLKREESLTLDEAT